MSIARLCAVVTGLVSLFPLLAHSGQINFPYTRLYITDAYTLDEVCNRTNGVTVKARPFISLAGRVASPADWTFYAPDGAGMHKQEASAPPGSRFTDNGNGTVTDNRTGLIWLANANVAGARDWATALADVVSLNSDGTVNGMFAGDTSKNGSHQTDWRLPGVKELQSLCDSEILNTGTQSISPFIGWLPYHYWSTTTGIPGKAWFVYMHNSAAYMGDKTGTGYVWPVRGGH